AYQPGWILTLLVMLAVAKGTQGLRGSNRVISLAVLYSAVFAALVPVSVRQQCFWHDTVALWTRQLAVEPTCAIVHNNIAAALVRVPPDLKSDARAEPHVRAALAKFPHHSAALSQLARVVQHRGK